MKEKEKEVKSIYTGKSKRKRSKFNGDFENKLFGKFFAHFDLVYKINGVLLKSGALGTIRRKVQYIISFR